MNTQTKYDANRVMRLIINDLKNHRKQIFIAAMAILIYWTLLPFQIISDSSQYLITLIFSGFLLTALSLKQFHEPHLAYHYLTLPCSNPERFISKLLLTAVLYPLALLALFYCFSVAGNIFHLWADYPITPLYSPLQSALWTGIGVYIVLHSIAFMGAILFKRRGVLKTILLLGCFLLVLSVLIGKIGIKLFSGSHISIGEDNIPNIIMIGKILFWLVTPIFFWSVAYLRMKECEIR